MKRHGIVVLGLVVASAVGGCAGDSDILAPPDRNTAAPVQTDATFYMLRKQGIALATEIPFRYENQTTHSLYIVNCRGGLNAVLEKNGDGGWEQFWGPVLLACLSPPIVIRPGSVLVDTLHVWGALPGHNAAPQFRSDDVEGIYRIVMHDVVFNYDEDKMGFGDPVPLNCRVSNRFFLDDPRR